MGIPPCCRFPTGTFQGHHRQLHLRRGHFQVRNQRWHLQDGRREPAEIPSKLIKNDGFWGTNHKKSHPNWWNFGIDGWLFFHKQKSHSRHIPYFFECFFKGHQLQQHAPSISMPTKQGSGLSCHKPTIWRWYKVTTHLWWCWGWFIALTLPQYMGMGQSLRPRMTTASYGHS